MTSSKKKRDTAPLEFHSAARAHLFKASARSCREEGGGHREGGREGGRVKVEKEVSQIPHRRSLLQLLLTVISETPSYLETADRPNGRRPISGSEMGFTTDLIFRGAAILRTTCSSHYYYQLHWFFQRGTSDPSV